MSFERIEEGRWRDLLDRLSRFVSNREAEVEVAGLDVGDQIEASWIGFEGVSLDERDVVVHLRGIDHRIVAPRELHIDRDGLDVKQLVLIDGEGREHFIRLREPLSLEGEVSAPPPA